MNKKLALIMLSGFVSFLISCLPYNEVELISVDNVEVKKFTMSGIRAEVTVKVSNPNNYKISIIDSDLDIYLNGIMMGKATIKETIVLEKKSKDSHRFTIDTNYTGASAGGLSAIMTLITSSSVNLGLKGTIKAKAKFIRKKVDVEFNERVSI
jgi:LEA14-like dessication related protein